MDASILHDAFIFSKENKAQLVNEINGYTITVDPNGGNWNGDTEKRVKNAVKGDIFTLPEAPERDGYKFLYWKGSEYQPGDEYVVQGNHTFIAEWEKNDKKSEGKSTPDKKTRVDKMPKTGDNLDLAVYAGLLAMMSVGVLLTLKKKDW